MAVKTLVQKFKVYTEVNSTDSEVLYNFLHKSKGILLQGDSLSIEIGSFQKLTVVVSQNDSRTVITFSDENMEVWVGRHYRETRNPEESNWGSEFEFTMNYDITPEWIFQISTQYDLGFIEHRYIKYLCKIKQLYSLKKEAEETA
jgi:hypothetical protein